MADLSMVNLIDEYTAILLQYNAVKSGNMDQKTILELIEMLKSEYEDYFINNTKMLLIAVYKCKYSNKDNNSEWYDLRRFAKECLLNLQVALDPRQHGYHKYGEHKIERVLISAQFEYEDCYNKEIYPVQEHYTQYTLTDILTKTVDELIAQE